MKKIKVCTFAILFLMTMAVLTACSRKDSGMNQTTSPSGTQSTSGTNQGGMNESGTGSTNGSTGTQESTSGSTQGNKKADEESSTGVIGGMIDDAEDGVDDMLNGRDASTESK